MVNPWKNSEKWSKSVEHFDQKQRTRLKFDPHLSSNRQRFAYLFD